MSGDPGGGPIQGVLSLFRDTWQAVVVPVGLAAWAIYKEVVSRREKRTGENQSVQHRREAEQERRDAEEAAEARAERENLRVREAAIYERFAAQFARQRDENAALVAEKEALRKDRDRGWDLARHYFGMAHDVDHDKRDARQIAIALMRKHLPGEPLPDWRQISVPRGLEDPIPK